jgi:hypothetical protein
MVAVSQVIITGLLWPIMKPVDFVPRAGFLWLLVKPVDFVPRQASCG